MKKTILAIAVVLSAYAGFSQDLMSKKGEAYLPEAGDYALGFDAVPLFNVLKFNDANAKIGSGYTTSGNSLGILIKRFSDAKNATRFGVNIDLKNTFLKEEVSAYSNGVIDGSDKAEDKIRTSDISINLSVGKEMRRGNTRVQGYYGGEVFLGLTGTRKNVEYGNNLADLPDSENSTYFADNNVSAADYGFDGSSYLEQSRSGIGFSVGARAFAGVEYFVAPKLSINAEYGFAAGLGFSPRGERDIVTVTGGNDNNETIKGTTRNTTFNVGTDFAQGAIRVLFHF